MLSLEARDIYDVIKPLHFYSKFIGLTAFSIEKKGKFVECFKVHNIFCLVISTVLCLVGCISHVLMTSSKANYFLPMSSFYFQILFCVVIGFSVVSSAANLWTFKERRTFSKILNSISEIDELLKQSNIPIDLKKHKKMIVGALIIIKLYCFVMMLVIVCVVEYSDVMKLSLFHALSLALCFENWFLINMQFIFMIWCIKSRFQKMNYFLKNNFLAFHLYDNFEKRQNLKKFAHLYGCLVYVTEKVNRFLGFPVSD
jgi:hypothetical protein